MEFLACVLTYVLGAFSVIAGFYLYPQIKREKNIPLEELKPDERERKLNEQWENMLNYDGNIRE